MGTWGSLRFWGSISCSGSRCRTQSRKHSVFPVFLGWDALYRETSKRAQTLIWIYQSCRLKIGHMRNLCCTNMVNNTLSVPPIGLWEALGGMMHDWLQHTNCISCNLHKLLNACVIIRSGFLVTCHFLVNIISVSIMLKGMLCFKRTPSLHLVAAYKCVAGWIFPSVLCTRGGRPWAAHVWQNMAPVRGDNGTLTEFTWPDWAVRQIGFNLLQCLQSGHPSPQHLNNPIQAESVCNLSHAVCATDIDASNHVACWGKRWDVKIRPRAFIWAVIKQVQSIIWS